jgi:hypothetical protein
VRCHALPHTAAHRQNNFTNPLDAFFWFHFCQLPTSNFWLLTSVLYTLIFDQRFAPKL